MTERVEQEGALDISRTEIGRESRTWWSGRWLRALGRWMSTGLLSTGRVYVRRGQVVRFDVEVGRVRATVRETDGRVCHVVVGLATHTDEVWSRVVGLMAGKVAYAAQLLNGEIPREVESLFRAAGASLFPEKRDEFEVTCTCPGLTTVCNHAAATCIAIGDALEADPFLLFTLRGRTREQLLSSLRAHRAARGMPDEPDVRRVGASLGDLGLEDSLASRLDDYWDMGDEMRGFEIRIRPPEVEMEAIKLLGVPSFVSDQSFLRRLRKVYSDVSRRALELAYEEYETAGDVDDGDVDVEDGDAEAKDSPKGRGSGEA